MTAILDSHPEPISATSRWRKARGQRLARMIADLALRTGHPITILDVGGTAEYWRHNIASEALIHVRRVTLLTDDVRDALKTPEEKFIYMIGDACDLHAYGDQSFDLVHSNSVIEHVGGWDRQSKMASETRRVGRAGWIQTPAFSFPVEPHFKMPFVHWFGQPIRRMLLMLGWYRVHSLPVRRWHVDRINLLTKAEVKALFGNCEIYVEHVCGLAKSYIVRWGG